jgi:hypothetical protein
MRASRPGHLPYCYLEHHRGRVVEYPLAIINLGGDPYVSGERSLSGGAVARGQVKFY